MGLLDKLEQVEIKADSRLPEDDLIFCETQQQAYDESCRALREIRQQWKKAIQAQRDLLGIGQDGSLPYFGSNYRFGITDLNRELEKFHSTLPCRQVSGREYSGPPTGHPSACKCSLLAVA